MEMSYEYINKGLKISKVAEILNIPRSRFYRNKIPDKNNDKSIKNGRKNSEFTLKINGNNTVVIDNSTVVNDIRKLLSGEFVCYGYKKTAKYLNRHGYIINKKKVRRLMSENNLLNYPYNNRKLATRVINTIVNVSSADHVSEFDRKYVWIHGKSRNTYMLAMINCYTREVVG